VAPRTAVDDDLKAALRARKTEIIALLEAERPDAVPPRTHGRIGPIAWRIALTYGRVAAVAPADWNVDRLDEVRRVHPDAWRRVLEAEHAVDEAGKRRAEDAGAERPFAQALERLEGALVALYGLPAPSETP